MARIDFPNVEFSLNYRESNKRFHGLCTVVTGGLIKCSWCFFFFFLSPHVLRGPSADRRKTLPHDRKLAGLNNPSPKIRGALPQKNLGPKHAKFRSILYNLRLWSRISPEPLKTSKLIFPDRFLLPSVKKVRWTLAHKLQRSWCEFGPIKMHFFGQLYFSH